jgi:hypothetical protein
MRVSFARGGLYVLFRYSTDDRGGLGFVIKPKSERMFSERYDCWRGFCIGPLYFRTYKRKERPGRAA